MTGRARIRSCATAPIGLDPGERFVAEAITRRTPAGGRNRSCGPPQADARDWANPSTWPDAQGRPAQPESERPTNRPARHECERPGCRGRRRATPCPRCACCVGTRMRPGSRSSVTGDPGHGCDPSRLALLTLSGLVGAESSASRKPAPHKRGTPVNGASAAASVQRFAHLQRFVEREGHARVAPLVDASADRAGRG